MRSAARVARGSSARVAFRAFGSSRLCDAYPDATHISRLRRLRTAAERFAAAELISASAAKLAKEKAESAKAAADFAARLKRENAEADAAYAAALAKGKK